MAQPGQPSSSVHTLPDEAVMNGFHMFTINSLAQAKLEGLLDEDSLASAEGDVMITGPALCLYFAALRSNTTPPSVPIPGTSRSSVPLVLSAETCPPVFRPFFRLWAGTVPTIQALPSAQQHDLARVICDKAPLTPSSTTPETHQTLTRVAADLRSVAIEITQRRTFQERYRSDLQSALDAGQTSGAPGEKRRVAAFAPPPSYDESSNGSHSQPSTQPSSVHSSPQRVPMTPSRLNAALPTTPNNNAVIEEGMPSIESTIEPVQTQSGSTSTGGSHLVVMNPGPSTSRDRGRPVSPTLLPPDAPAINFIRETLYAALAEVIGTHPSIKSLLVSDPSRAYFSSVALSILTVSTDCITPDGGVITPVGHVLTLQECPKPYQPLMVELGNIGKEAKRIMQEDDEKAILAVRDGDGRNIAEPRMERLKRMLEYGVAAEEERYNAAAVAPAPAPVPASASTGRNRYNAPTTPPPNRSGVPGPVPVSPNQQAAARASLEHARQSLEQELQQQAPSHLDPRLSPNGTASGRLTAPLAVGRPSSPSGSSDGGRSSEEHAYHSDSQVRTSHESRRRLSGENSSQNRNASSSSTPPKKEPKRRSSSEERSSGKGLRGLLRKSKPNNPVPPPVAPKPLPPNARPAVKGEANPPTKYGGSPPATASSSSYTQQHQTTESPVSPTGGGFTGVGAGAGRPTNPGPIPMPIPRVNGAPQLHPNQRPPQISSPPLQNTPQAYQLAQIPPGRTATPPHAAMMAHQGSIHVTGSPYEHALGSGLRIAGEEYSGVLQSSNNHNPNQRQGQPQATGVGNIPSSNSSNSPRRPHADISSPMPSSAASQPPLSALNTNPANPPIEIMPSTQPPSPEEPAPRRSMEGSTVQFANKINGLALKLTSLRMFQERAEVVFKILASVAD